MIEKFLDYLAVEKRYSPHTVISYKKDLADLKTFISKTEGHEDLTKINKRVVRNFIVELSELGISKRSINRKLSTLRRFYKFLLQLNAVEISPVEGISTLKFYPEKQQPFSIDELNQLQQTDLYKDEDKILQKTIIETLYQTGMRRAELINLRLNNVDFYKNEIKVIGKGNKARIIPITENLSEILKNYKSTRKPNENATIYFFINEKGKKLTDKFVYLTVNNYFSIVSSKEKKSPHMLRHSFATHILNNGAEISKVKSILGHSSLASTQAYTDANIEQLKKAFNNAHPRAKDEE